MDIKEVIDIVEDVTWNDGGRHYGEIEPARNSVIEALEKQLPETPILQNDKINYWYECGKCNHIISEITDKYCSHCGQKIKWE